MVSVTLLSVRLVVFGWSLLVVTIIVFDPFDIVWIVASTWNGAGKRVVNK